jgi:hypothetical protein
MISKRLVIWGVVVLGILVNFATPLALGNADYVPTVANGLLTAISILASMALFLSAHFYQSIENVSARGRYRYIMSSYLLVFLFAIFIAIGLGYRLILTARLVEAYLVFTSCSFFSIGAVFDLLIVSQDFLFVNELTYVRSSGN